MTTELIALAIVALEHVVLVFWSQMLLTRDVGPEGNAGPRDDLPDFSQQTGRLRRALANHTENFPFFIGAVAVVLLSGSANGVTATCALIYAAARAVYIPAYAFGWTPWRSVIFMCGFLATCVMYVAAFF
ncbi:MAPEG family protein [Pseudooceanicola marinus]|uniref:MAPEG family protein n=1 Tax=Pseudooceanicola marinus TaxID=396013 RepID=A0A1X6Z2K6_9RHOB|nr:MAPEG family protein [Pseudooceanicola marinus]PJE32355.1 MAPEG family protein [Pseudooceanicola marinus]SLN39054.1 MAPEG family protein [Pseudooceanicola marinus]